MVVLAVAAVPDDGLVVGVARLRVPFAEASHFGPFVAASSAGVLSIVNGTGRALVGWVSDRIGRRQTLTWVLVIAAVAQFGVLWSGDTHNSVLFMFFAFLTGSIAGLPISTGRPRTLRALRGRSGG